MLSDEEILQLYPHVARLIEDRLSQRLDCGLTAQGLNLGLTDGAGKGELWATGSLRARGGLVLGDTGYAPPAGTVLATERAAAPDAPANGMRLLYPRAGQWYEMDSSGSEAALVNATGWVRDRVTWTYASGTTLTRTGASAEIFPTGAKVRYKQGGGYKFAYVVSVSGDTVTLFAGTSYSLANAAITDAAVSLAVCPAGFPGRFDFSASWTAVTTNPAIGNGTVTARAWMIGKQVSQYVEINMGTTTTFGSGQWMIGQAVPTAVGRTLGLLSCFDASGSVKIMGFGEASATGFLLYSDAAGVTSAAPFTWASGDRLIFLAVYTL